MTDPRPNRLWLLPILLSALACSQAPVVKPLPTHEEARAARATDLRDTQALLLLMADQKRFEEGVFIGLLDSSASVRRDLAVTLGRIGDGRGRGILQGLLVDIDAGVRQSAAFALGELGAVEASPSLLRAAVDDDTTTGVLAVEALGKLQASLAEVRKTLSALEPQEAALRLAPALFRFKEDGVVETASELLANADPAIRRAAAYALGRDARAGALPHLRRLLVDPEASIRAWAARGLGEVGDLSDLAAMEPLLAAPYPSPRMQALRAGGRILARTQAVPPLTWGSLLAAQIDDPLPGVRAVAIESAAAWLTQPEVREALLRRLAAGEPRERELALSELVEADDAAAEDAVRAAAGAPMRALRARAAEAAAMLGLDDLVEKLAADPEAMVRLAAIEGRLAIAPDADGDPSGEVGNLARRFLADSDPAVRATILEALVALPALPVSALGEALAKAEPDTLPDVRLAAIRALAARAGVAPGESEAAVALLERLAENRDFLVRREAAAALVRLGEKQPDVGPVATQRTGPVYSQILLQTDRPRRVEVTTERGAFRILLACPQAPLTCLSFLQLAGQGYFDGLSFHRVVPDFVVQTGDPRGDGWGGPGFALRDEINRLRFGRGAVGMALSGPDTGGSQFFITLSPQPHLDGGYTVFGQVEGDDAVLDQIRQDDRLLSIKEVETGE